MGLRLCAAWRPAVGVTMRRMRVRLVDRLTIRTGGLRNTAEVVRYAARRGIVR
jgi:hypothetical protein